MSKLVMIMISSGGDKKWKLHELVRTKEGGKPEMLRLV
jgi:hypothetical protein